MKNMKTGNNFDAIVSNLKSSLEEHHKYRCGSDEHRADLAADYDLPKMPHQEIYGTPVDCPKDATPEERGAIYTAEHVRRGGTDAMEAEVDAFWEKHDDVYFDSEMDHNFEQSSYIAFDILELLKHSTCEHCGDTHTSHGLDDDGTAFEYEGLLLNLFEVVAYELLERGANLKYSLGERQRLLDIVTRLNPPKNVEAA